MPNGTQVTTDGPAGSKEKCWNSGIHWAQGRDCASATAAAPTVVMSISSASGSTSSIARRRSGTSWVARVAKVASAFARPSSGVAASKSASGTSSISGATGSAWRPSARRVATSEASVRTWIS